MEVIKKSQLGEPITYDDRNMTFEVDGEQINVSIQLLGRSYEKPASRITPKEFTLECTGINVLCAEYAGTGEEVEIEGGNLDEYRDIYSISYLFDSL